MSRLRVSFILIAAVAVSSLLFLGPTPGDYLLADGLYERSLKNLWNLGHVVFFCLLSYVVLHYVNKDSALVLGFCFFTLLLLGIAIEGAQWVVGRSASWSDFGLNALGLTLGFSFSLLHRALGKLLLCAALPMLAFVLVRPVHEFLDELDAKSAFPILADFETKHQISRFKFIGSSGEINQMKLNVQFGDANYSVVELYYFPSNWQAYAVLNIAVTNHQATAMKLNCRIHDWDHGQTEMPYDDRFNIENILAPGSNLLSYSMADVASAPRLRTMDLEKIVALICFTRALESPARLSFDKFWLSK